MADSNDFYRTRDAMNGGTDNVWTQYADFEPAGPADKAEDGLEVSDMRADDDVRFSGVLSQSDLAS